VEGIMAKKKIINYLDQIRELVEVANRKEEPAPATEAKEKPGTLKLEDRIFRDTKIRIYHR